MIYDLPFIFIELRILSRCNCKRCLNNKKKDDVIMKFKRSLVITL